MNLVSIDSESGCWNWTGAHRASGYGLFDGRTATRVSYETFVGPIPDGLFVCHQCDNPPCINPQHLFLGTRSENMRDCIHKKRFGSIKWTHADVARMRQLQSEGHSRFAIAKLFNVHHSSIIRLLNNEAYWQSIPNS